MKAISAGLTLIAKIAAGHAQKYQPSTRERD